MTAYESMQIRRSVRKYEMESLSQRLLAQIGEDIASLKPLYPQAQISFEIRAGEQMDAAYRVGIRAPYYVVILAEPTSKGRMNAGFMGEQLVLSLTTRGLGTCWLGSTSPKKKKKEAPFLMAISFGRPLESGLLETKYTHKRKPLEELLVGKDKLSAAMRDVLSAARLAPSAVNLQPCRYLVNGDAVAIVRRKVLVPHLDRMQDTDCGIALAHMDVAARDKGLTVLETDLAAFAHSVSGYRYAYGLLFRHSHAE